MSKTETMCFMNIFFFRNLRTIKSKIFFLCKESNISEYDSKMFGMILVNIHCEIIVFNYYITIAYMKNCSEKSFSTNSIFVNIYVFIWKLYFAIVNIIPNRYYLYNLSLNPNIDVFFFTVNEIPFWKKTTDNMNFIFLKN